MVKFCSRTWPDNVWIIIEKLPVQPDVDLEVSPESVNVILLPRMIFSPRRLCKVKFNPSAARECSSYCSVKIPSKVFSFDETSILRMT